MNPCLIESIVSAAASRIGKTVLHIDSDNYYGGHWASFSLTAIQNFLKEQLESQHPKSSSELSIGNNLFNVKNIEIHSNIPKKTANSSSNSIEFPNCSEHANSSVSVDNLHTNIQEWQFTTESLLNDSRKFNIDLAPKLQYARGQFVELLISSNIARYSEYRSVSRVLTWLNGQLEVVPCSRADVFANDKVTLIEKRILMKLLTSLEDDRQNLQEYENKMFSSYLKDKKLTSNLIHYVLYAISQSTDSTPCLKGIENTKRFLNSLGRFGKTPFLFSMYGSGETTQAFCRLSAVFGGIFALSQPLQHLILNDHQVVALVSGDQKIYADNFVISLQKAPAKFVKSVQIKEYISRAVFITDCSLMPSEQEHLTLLMYPPEKGKHLTTLIEMGSLTGTCPKNLFLVHLIAKQEVNPQDDFKHIVQNLFTNEVNEENLKAKCKPQILWSCYFSLPNTCNLDLKAHNCKNVYVCGGPDLDLDYDLSMETAKSIFKKIYPEDEFLPRAPDPEEIIFGEEPDTSERSVSLGNVHHKEESGNIPLQNQDNDNSTS
ncbi:rab proteins geranylgeranyltransferase component A 1 isoform X2 [Cylas formicarius]|uniref:rab proteins geranylgeranyltransferase component A 1 isoform X2 n=1 Tax=Cylas formicarius TaxID=197179 RepID=UPI0029588C94|nr:rab proteins geranylgeranyltransferase component A 1 isoform X2 [Cylas formicarius]